MNHPTPLIHSSVNVAPSRLQQLVSYIKGRAVLERERLGWQEARGFPKDSMFGKWAQFELQAEQDFSMRKKRTASMRTPT